MECYPPPATKLLLVLLLTLAAVGDYWPFECISLLFGFIVFAVGAQIGATLGKDHH